MPAFHELLCHVPDAKVVWADYVYWKKLVRCHGKSHADTVSVVKNFLTTEFAYISAPHIAPNRVNTSIYTDDQRRKVYRPPGYGRAAVFRTAIGLFDVKGIGVSPGKVPIAEVHRTGLLSLPAAIAEVCVESYLRKNLGVERPHTVKCLAIIVLPFFIKRDEVVGLPVYAALLVREHFPRLAPTTRNACIHPFISAMCMHYEHLLRTVSMTSVVYDKNIEWKDTFRCFMGGDPCSLRFSTIICREATKCGLAPPQRFSVLNVQLCFDPSSRKVLLTDFGSYYFDEAMNDWFVIYFGNEKNIFGRTKSQDRDNKLGGDLGSLDDHLRIGYSDKSSIKASSEIKKFAEENFKMCRYYQNHERNHINNSRYTKKMLVDFYEIIQCEHYLVDVENYIHDHMVNMFHVCKN